jgi:asparagine synthase (glutamine-hydrolysing)
MCGIIGFWDSSFRLKSRLGFLAEQMCTSLHHRGPDASGVWVSEENGLALGHRRLSIIDLSSAGNQPMSSSYADCTIVFNGEIYNHLQLRIELEKSGYLPNWHGHSDTETLLAALVTWGIEATLKKIVGMFAFALWDGRSQSLILARDRIGEKPLYYGWQGDTFLFASELKALKTHPSFKPEVDRRALKLFMNKNYIPAPLSIYKNIFKLVPGTYYSLCLRDHKEQSKTYWSVREAADAGQLEPFSGTEQDALEELNRLLTQSITAQMSSDVPLGAFLSGGIDSSTVTALMQSQTSSPIQTFTVGFLNKNYNEANHAKAVASYLGTNHTEIYATSEDAIGIIPLLPNLYDEPFADSSQISTFLLAKLAAKNVTVALSGDGGDELFGGYSRYYWANNMWQINRKMPQSIRVALAQLIKAFPPQTWNFIFQIFSHLLPDNLRYPNSGDKLYKFASVLSSRTQEEIYKDLITFWDQPSKIVIDDKNYLGFDDQIKLSNLRDFSHKMMYEDMITYLPDDILVKIDRASMGSSLETRIPFLDHRLVEFSWKLPLSMKIKNSQGKWILRQLLYKYIPRELVDRPKMGFGVPIDIWLRGPLRGWAESLLSENRLQQQGFFYPAPIREKWSEHISGKRNWAYMLWSVLMFQAWSEENL